MKNIDDQISEDGYIIVPPIQEIKGYKCGECGIKFEPNKAYGYVCNNDKCPMQVRIT